MPIPVASGVDARRALTLLEQPEKFPGVGVTAEPARAYPRPDGALAAHLLGWVARAGADDVTRGQGRIDAEDAVGRSGLEEQYDAVLRGSNGSTVVAIDPRGIVTGTVGSTPAVPGRDVVTHLDARLQARTEATLVRAVAAAHADHLRADNPPPRSSSTSPTAPSWPRERAYRPTTRRSSPAASAPLTSRA